MKVALYARCSTKDKDQNPETQLLKLREEAARLGAEVFKEYVDMASALDFKNRSAWRDLMHDARKRRFDVVLVHKLDRAFRSIIHLHNTLDEWDMFGVQFKSFSDPIDTHSSGGRLMLNILASFAEFERDMIAERVRAGMERARQKGTKTGKAIGRPRVINSPKALRRFKTILKRYQAHEIGLREAARHFGCGAGTFKRYAEGLNEAEQK